MASVEMKTEKRKKMILKISMVFLIVIAMLTFFSNTINNFLLPQVNIVYIDKGSLNRSIEKEGKIEMLNKQDIYASGEWKVKEIYVKKDQKVKKGMAIALVDEDEALIELKNKQLEIVKLENQLKKRTNEFKEGTGKSLRASVELAARKLEDVKMSFESLKERYNAGVGLETAESFNKAKKEYEDAQNDYDEKLRSLNIAEQENEIDVSEIKAELDIKKNEFSKYKSGIPQNGKIISNHDGIVLAVNVDKGQRTVADKVLFTIGQEDSKFRVTWTMEMNESELFDTGDKVNISLKVQAPKKGDEEEQSVKDVILSKKISGKEYIEEEKRYKYWADIEITEGKIVEGQDIEVTAVKQSKIYSMVLPRNCITQKNDKYSVFVLKERIGSFGKEKYVEEVEVEILDKDDSFCAISAAIGKEPEIVENSTKPLQDGMQVRLR
jgi:multidrug efflux pump subunit AcrA (membrane-fusion protein)